MKKLIIFLMMAAVTQAYAYEEPVYQEDVSPDIIGAVRYANTQMDIEEGYVSNLDMREKRKIGVGMQVGGGLGTAGLNLEVNVDAQNAAIAGVGTGAGYGTFQILWRHSFEGKYFTPYTSAGWSRWYNSDNSEDHRRSLILERALNEEQMQSGRFGVDFLTASFGMQYNQLSGEAAGTTFFLEFAMMSSLGNFTPIPTGSIGATYYF